MAEVTTVSEATAGVKPALTTPKETQLTPEQRVSETVSQVEALFAKREIPRAPGERKMMCGFSADITARAATRGGLEADKHQLFKIHQALGAPNAPRDTLQHGMNIVRAGDEVYVIDISFTQFMDPEIGEIRQNPVHVPVKYADNPIAQELIKKGYFKLTDESLRAYLDLSSASPDKSYIQAATVEKLLSIDPKSVTQQFDHSDAYLDRLLDGETWIIE